MATPNRNTEVAVCPISSLPCAHSALVQQINSKVDQVLEDVKTLNKTILLGNGAPGLVTRVAVLETASTTKAAADERKSNRTTVLLYALVAVVAADFLQLCYSIAKTVLKVGGA